MTTMKNPQTSLAFRARRAFCVDACLRALTEHNLFAMADAHAATEPLGAAEVSFDMRVGNLKRTFKCKAFVVPDFIRIEAWAFDPLFNAVCMVEQISPGHWRLKMPSKVTNAAFRIPRDEMLGLVTLVDLGPEYESRDDGHMVELLAFERKCKADVEFENIGAENGIMFFAEAK